MLKTGIYRLDQLVPSHGDRAQSLRKFLAVTLYPQVIAANHQDSDRILERILARFATPNGTYKRTQRRRFGAFDMSVVQLMRQTLASDAPCSIHDMAVSDGRTAVDFFDSIVTETDLDITFLASDASPDVVVLQDSDDGFEVVVDPRSAMPLQVVSPPFVFNVRQPEHPLLYPVNRAVLAVLLRTRVKKIVRDYRAGDGRVDARAIRLLSPECLRLLAIDSRFDFTTYDILEPPVGRFRVVRAMNVLNRSYFDGTDLRAAIQNAWSSLLPGGLFVTGSNEDAGSTVNGAVYQRTDSGFEELWRSGAGSPVDRLVVGAGTVGPLQSAGEHPA
jgi:hypothetical protein